MMYGWLSVNKGVLVMKKGKIVGYMLGNSNNVVARGEQWCDAGMPVYICASKDVAQTILEESQRCVLDPKNVVWTIIYRVHAKDIKIDKYENNLMWTHQGNKIIVDEPVFYRNAPKISEQRLLDNATHFAPYFSDLINGRKRKVR